MSHDIEIKENGQAATFYVGSDIPWHGLGHNFQQPPTIEEAIPAAGLDWDVKTKPLFTGEGEEVNAQATYRTDTNAILGVVGPKYTPLQNTEAFNFFKPFLDSGEATLETAGSLQNGKRIWALAKLNRDPSVIVGEDIVNKYVLLSNAHDGTLAVRAGFTPIRVVCNNTLKMAHDAATSQLIRIRHSQNVAMNLEGVRDIMNVANAQFEATADQYRALAAKQISAKDLERYVKIVFSQKKNISIEELDAQTSRILPNIVNLFENGRGTDMAGVRGTYWAAYNAVSEYLQYEKGASESTRLNSLWFGTSATQNQKALDIAIEMAVAA